MHSRKPKSPTDPAVATGTASQQPAGTNGSIPAEEPVVHHLDEDWAPEESIPAVEAGRALEEAEDRFLRLAAEYDNYRRRTIKEKAESFDRGASDFASQLLDVLDDFDRLLSSESATTDYPVYREAVELIVRKLGKELEAAGLTKLDPTGTKFDPNAQDAVAIAMPEDPALDDTVKATFQCGYLFRGTVIRPAKVQVWSLDGAL